MRNIISRKPKDKIATVSVIWGYCITCHKSQGSEWPYVIVVDEGVAYNRNKWLYTAITRASENLVMFVTGGK
jgi:exodeoxyribonuclease-5